MKLAVFDMDGVVFQGANFWLEFHHKMKTSDRALMLWKNYGAKDYSRLSTLTAELWQGCSSKLYFEMILRRQYTAGLFDFISHLKKSNFQICIISSGPWHLASRAKDQLQLDYIFANRLGLDENGFFDGTVEVQVDDNFKGKVLRSLQKELGVSLRDTMVIGDTARDANMGQVAGHSIGFRVRDRESRKLFGNLVDGNSLAAAIPLVDAA